ncbi:ccr4 associated factor [Coemansia javaensis]|uniref:Ccr4 associated factor n=1 Tax=Coemansia javaensis TaxID=2761396 RepID=A0A9W8LLG0_9FUNG|nr:ccr4 associated factor [Coemansia javaensis]
MEAVRRCRLLRGVVPRLGGLVVPQLARNGTAAAAAAAAVRVERATDLEGVFDGADRYAAVAGRGVIEVSGADAGEFLQGMQCNHMPQIEQGGPGMATGFLAPQGRMVADGFVYPKNAGVNFPHAAYLVEVDARVRGRVQRQLEFHRLRARVAIRDATAEYGVWSVWGPRSAALVGGSSGGRALGHVPRGGLVLDRGLAAAGDVWAVDARAPGMGLRLLVARPAEPRLPGGFERRGAAEYRLRRILKGVAEGADDFVPGVAVPLECNLDYMGGVSFAKGCYVGQELTIRTHHRGVVRKRIVPALLAHARPGADGSRSPLCVDYAWDAAVPPQAEIARVTTATADSADSADPAPAARARRVPPGRIGSTACNAALALMRLEHVEQYEAQQGSGAVAFEATCADGRRVFVSPWTPSWWPSSTLK